MTKNQEEHVKQFGQKNFHRLVVAASMVVRSDARLLGADKIRKEITEWAALEASGYPRRPFMLTKHCGTLTKEIDDVARDVFERAYKAACEVIAVPA